MVSGSSLVEHWGLVEERRVRTRQSQSSSLFIAKAIGLTEEILENRRKTSGMSKGIGRVGGRSYTVVVLVRRSSKSRGVNVAEKSTITEVIQQP